MQDLAADACLLAERSVHEPRHERVEPREEALGPAEEPLGLVALDRGDDALGDIAGRVHRHPRPGGEAIERGRVGLGARGTRRNVGHADSARGHLAAERLGEPAQPELRGRVGGAVRKADGAEHRADVHDARPRLEVRQRRPGEEHRRDQVRRHDPGDRLGALALERVEARHPGVVHEQIDASEDRERARDQGLVARARREVEHHRIRAAAHREDLVADRRHGGRIAADEHEPRPAAGQPACELAPDPSARAGEQHSCAVQFHDVASVSVSQGRTPWRRRLAAFDLPSIPARRAGSLAGCLMQPP